MQEESKSDSSEEDAGIVQKKTVTKKVNYFQNLNKKVGHLDDNDLMQVIREDEELSKDFAKKQKYMQRRYADKNKFNGT